MAEETTVAVFNEGMMQEAEKTSHAASVMSGIHEVKAYNANMKDGVLDPELEGKFRVKVGMTGDLEYIESFKFNPLSVCKVKSGNVYLLDEFGDEITDLQGNKKSSLFYTNEHSIYTRKIDVLGFKGNGQVVGYYEKGAFDQMLRCRKMQLEGLDGVRSDIKDNPFFKSSTSKDGVPYNDTHITDTYVMYGVFIDGKFAGEYFKMYMTGNTFGKTFQKDVGKIAPKEGTVQYCGMISGLKAWNEMRESQGKQQLKSVELSQLDLVAKTEAITINGKIIYLSKFTYDMLTGYRTNNIEDVQFITQLQKDYFDQEFKELKHANVIKFENNNKLAIFTGEIKYPVIKGIEGEENDQLAIEEATGIFDGDTEEESMTAPVKPKPEVERPASKTVSIEDVPFNK